MVVVMVMLVIVDVLMGMGHTVVGVLVGMRMVVVVRKTHMIMIEMHRNQSPFDVFYIIIPNEAGVKTFIFVYNPPGGLAIPGRPVYNGLIRLEKEGAKCPIFMKIPSKWSTTTPTSMPTALPTATVTFTKTSGR